MKCAYNFIFKKKNIPSFFMFTELYMFTSVYAIYIMFWIYWLDIGLYTYYMSRREILRSKGVKEVEKWGVKEVGKKKSRRLKMWSKGGWKEKVKEVENEE